MSLPSYAVWFRGKPACPCLAKWLPVYEAELQRRGLLDGPLPIYQLIGGAAASGGTHATGGAFDISDLTGDADVWVARQMGADATWARTRAQGFTPHLHGVLRGCGHNSPARYQIAAVDAGFNGLGRGGEGAKDDGPRPLSGRTWREGIAWAIEQGDEMNEADWSRMEKLVDARIEAALLVEQGNGKTRDTNIRRGGDAKDLSKKAVDLVEALAKELAAHRSAGQ